MQPIGFEEHIKTMFRPRDRQSMQFAFDLGPTMTSQRTPTTSSLEFAPAQCPVTGRGQRTSRHLSELGHRRQTAMSKEDRVSLNEAVDVRELVTSAGTAR
jgi:hypothetical protein